MSENTVKAMRKEFDAVCKIALEADEHIAALEAENAELCEQADMLAAALDLFGNHRPHCLSWSGGVCDCGYQHFKNTGEVITAGVDALEAYRKKGE